MIHAGSEIAPKKIYICNPVYNQGPGGGIGRRAGLKILFPLREYGFDSRPRHKKRLNEPFFYLCLFKSIRDF